MQTSVCVNLVGPQVSLPLWWVPASRGYSFFVRNKEALPCVRRYSWWVRAVSKMNFCFVKDRVPSDGSQLSGGGIIILHVIRRHLLVWAPTVSLFRWLSFVDQVDQAALRAPWRWTKVRPRKGTTRSRGRLGNDCPHGGEYEGLLVRLPSPENNRRCG